MPSVLARFAVAVAAAAGVGEAIRHTAEESPALLAKKALAGQFMGMDCFCRSGQNEEDPVNRFQIEFEVDRHTKTAGMRAINCAAGTTIGGHANVEDLVNEPMLPESVVMSGVKLSRCHGECKPCRK